MSNAPSQLDRILTPSRNLERGEIPELSLSGIYEYTVIAATPLGVSAQPTKAGLPPIQLAPAGNIGVTTLLALIGQNVLVAFINQDPSRPTVLHVNITSTMILDSTMTTSAGPVTIALPIVAPLTSA